MKSRGIDLKRSDMDVSSWEDFHSLSNNQTSKNNKTGGNFGSQENANENKGSGDKRRSDAIIQNNTRNKSDESSLSEKETRTDSGMGIFAPYSGNNRKRVDDNGVSRLSDNKYSAYKGDREKTVDNKVNESSEDRFAPYSGNSEKRTDGSEASLPLEDKFAPYGGSGEKKVNDSRVNTPSDGGRSVDRRDRDRTGDSASYRQSNNKYSSNRGDGDKTEDNKVNVLSEDKFAPYGRNDERGVGDDKVKRSSEDNRPLYRSVGTATDDDKVDGLSEAKFAPYGGNSERRVDDNGVNRPTDNKNSVRNREREQRTEGSVGSVPSRNEFNSRRGDRDRAESNRTSEKTPATNREDGEKGRSYGNGETGKRASQRFPREDRSGRRYSGERRDRDASDGRGRRNGERRDYDSNASKNTSPVYDCSDVRNASVEYKHFGHFKG